MPDFTDAIPLAHRARVIEAICAQSGYVPSTPEVPNPLTPKQFVNRLYMTEMKMKVKQYEAARDAAAAAKAASERVDSELTF